MTSADDTPAEYAPGRVDTALADFDFRAATAAVWRVIDEANRYVSQAQPWVVAALEQAGDQTAAARLDAILAVLIRACATIADLLAQARPPLKKVVAETDRTAGTVLGDREFFDHYLDTWPDALKILNRQGLTGDWFSFYLCDVVLKVNGKGGQPVFVKLVGQPSGRCTPR